jgi:phosphoribosylformimino-5-aminoimidazole carboxamide ribotide isomerase
MLIPSIDLMDGRVVQLEQGTRLVFETRDVDGWLERFAAWPIVQVIDLDAAIGRGGNEALVRAICTRRACQVGGGLRTVDAVRRCLDAGAVRAIVGSALFDADGVNVEAARQFAEAVSPGSLVAAVDSRAGHVVIHGWKTPVPTSAVAAVRVLEPHVGAFLYTHVDTEGLLRGTDFDAVRAVRAATTRKVIAAGGIRSVAEIDRLHAMGVDAVVGMAVYRGLIDLTQSPCLRD